MAELQIVQAAVMKNVEAQYVEMRVPLYSYGCEKKIKKALANLRGIYSVDVNFNEQKVTVWGICNKYDLLDTIRNKRKGAHFWNPEGNDNLVLGSVEETSADNHAEVSSSSSSLPSVCRRKGKGLSLPPLTLIRCRSSLSWKTWKKVFLRSYSF